MPSREYTELEKLELTDAKDLWNATNPDLVEMNDQEDAEVHLKHCLKDSIIQHRWDSNKGYERFKVLLSKLEIHGAGVLLKCNQKFLRSLLQLGYQFPLILRNKPVAMISMRIKEVLQEDWRRDGWNSRNKDGSRTGKKEESKAMVTVDGESVDWTTHSGDDENYAFMASNSSGSITQNKGAYTQAIKKAEAQLVAHQQGQLWETMLPYLSDFQDFNGGPVALWMVVKVYIPGQQESNQNTGTKDKIGVGDSDKVVETEQDCFELPIWHSYFHKIGLSTREEEQVFLDHLARLSNGRKEANEEVINISSTNKKAKVIKVLYEAHAFKISEALEDEDGLMLCRKELLEAIGDLFSICLNHYGLYSLTDGCEECLSIMARLMKMEITQLEVVNFLTGGLITFGNAKSNHCGHFNNGSGYVAASSAVASFMGLKSMLDYGSTSIQLANIVVPLDHFPVNSLTSKVFSFMIKKGKHFSGKVTPLFDTMLVQPAQDEGASSERLSVEQPSPSPTPTDEIPNESLPGLIPLLNILFCGLGYGVFNYGVICEDEAKRRNSGDKTKTFEENGYPLPYAVSSNEYTAYQRQLITRIRVKINSRFGVSLLTLYAVCPAGRQSKICS
ncbi:hypothetical protein Tco_1042513 [Tanacetum coccineum]|uniref:Uncharacterized protein n=1 Tax=Tanacetum coccineum TaxID=301880 RepID=A0ABQ5GLZ5_9ASTR